VAQLPSLHTIPVPQPLPLAAFVDSMQTDFPPEQSMVPARQGLSGMSQVLPDMQAMHAPSLHTEFGPHMVPFA
jgi:hypothetical protein